MTNSKESNVELTIVIPVYNQSNFTKDILKNLDDTLDVRTKLIIIDNGSIDDTSELLNTWKPKVKSKIKKYEVITNKTNEGVTKPWNKGLELAEGKYVAFLNNDLVLSKKWASLLIECLEQNDNVWCVCPNFTRLDLSVNFEERCEEHSSRQLTYEPVIPPGNVGGFCGFCFMIKLKEMREEIGGFDKNFVIWCNDSDLWQQLKVRNKPAVRVNNVLIHHYESKTLGNIPGIEQQINADVQKFEAKWRFKERIVEKGKKKFNAGVMIALPSRGEVCIDWALHMMLLIQRVPIGMGLAIKRIEGQEVDVARTLLVEDALNSNVQKIFFIDDDTFVPLDTISQLARVDDKDIVTGVVWSKTDPALPCIFREEATGAWVDWTPGKLLPVRRAGLACCMIDSDVFRNVDKPWFKMGYSYITEEGANVSVKAGEDFFFYDRAIKAGYEPYVDTSVMCSHYDVNNKRHFPGEGVVRSYRMRQRLELEKNMALDKIAKKEDLSLWERRKVLDDFVNELKDEIRDVDIEIIKSK